MLSHNILTTYIHQMAARPLLTRCCTAMTFMGVGDILIQTQAQKRSLWASDPNERVQLSQTATKMGIAFFMLSPSLYMWYSKIMPKIMDSKLLSARKRLEKSLLITAVDQTLFASFCTGGFLTAYGYSVYGNVSQTLHNARTNLPKIVRSGWAFWPAAVLINLMVVPPLFRTVFINALMIFWNLHLVRSQGTQIFLADDIPPHATPILKKSIDNLDYSDLSGDYIKYLIGSTSQNVSIRTMG